MITTASPSAKSRPAVIASWWPKFRARKSSLTRSSRALSSLITSRLRSVLPSSTRMNSHSPSIWAATASSLRCSSGSTSSSLRTGATNEILSMALRVSCFPMPTLDRAEGQVGAPGQPGREFGSSALLASLALAGSFVALGLNSILVSRIEGSDGAGLIALSTQFVFIATFVAGGGLRTSVTYRVGAGLWSPRSAIRGALIAVISLGVLGAALGMGTYALLKDSAMQDFNLAMAASLMAALPFALAWWIFPAVPLARERYETYALLTVSGPIC